MFRISVAVCTLNGERYLQEQLESIAAQTLPPFELVLCDDGSTDRTLEIADSFAQRAAFAVRVVRNEQRLGVTANFSKCLRMCRGELLALADQDDHWLPGKLEAVADVFGRDPAVTCVFSNAGLIDPESHRTGQDAWSRFLFTPALQRQMLAGDAAGVLLRVPVVSGAAMVFRASLLNRALPIPDGWVHDAWLAWMAVLSGRLYPINEDLIEYRLHAAQQLGLAAESGRQRLRRMGVLSTLAREKAEAGRQYEHMARTYAQLADFVDRHNLGPVELRSAIRRKSVFAGHVLALLRAPRLLRLLPALPLLRDYRRFTPRGVQTILRHALL